MIANAGSLSSCLHTHPSTCGHRFEHNGWLTWAPEGRFRSEWFIYRHGGGTTRGDGMAEQEVLQGPQLAAIEAQLHALLRSQAKNMLFQLIYLVLISGMFVPSRCNPLSWSLLKPAVPKDSLHVHKH